MNLDTAIPVGRGATGEVLRAYHADRREQVAIKILSSDDPSLIARMQREALAQQRLVHPNICPVYGVDELNGQRCIIMRFIDGRPLDQAAAGLPLAEKVALIRTVADAVALAHKAGVIHRDLKPANILIEKTAAGLHPWVVDFGLARHVEDQTLTQHGQALGTPGYMAPEQARGVKALDPRCDVFALGVLLFELAAGRRPHSADSIAGLLLKTVSEDAPDVRRFAGEVPEGLARIINQCLERSPALRYADASAVRDDLDAFLTGGKVRARSSGFFHRLRRRAVRNRAASALVAALLVALVGVGVIALASTISRANYAREQSELARHYAAVAADLESRLRLIYSRPVHDVRDEVGRIVAAVQQLERDAPAGQPAAEATIRYALGRAWFALGRLQAARESLEAAWRRGMRSDEVALYLGLTYVAQHGEALRRARLEPNPELRRERELALRHSLLEPGLDHLRRAADLGSEHARLGRAQLLYYDGRVAAALDDLTAAGREMDWPAPALLASGLLRIEQAAALSVEESAAAVEAGLLRAAADIDAALELARSDPQVHRARCRIAAMRLDLRVQGLPAGVDEAFALDACGSLLVIDGDDSDNLLAAAAAHERLAALRNMRNQDADESWRHALALTDRALAIDSGNAEAWYRRGLARLDGAQFALEDGADPGPLLDQAIADLEHAIELEPGLPSWHLGLATALAWSARERYTRGTSGDDRYQRAVDLLEGASQLPGVGASARVQLPYYLTLQGYYRYTTGLEAADLLQSAVSEARTVVVAFPELAHTHSVHGFAAWTLADFLLMTGADPEPYAAEAVAAYQQALRIDPTRFAARYNLFTCRLVRIQGLLRYGRSAAEDLRAAEALLERLFHDFPDDPGMMIQQAALRRVQGLAAIQAGGDPIALFDESRAALQRARATAIDRVEVLSNLAWLAVSEHQWRAQNARFERARFHDDLASLGQALDELPELRIVRAERGMLALIGAESGLLDAAEAASLKRQAGADLAEATTGNLPLERRYRAVMERLAVGPSGPVD